MCLEQIMSIIQTVGLILVGAAQVLFAYRLWSVAKQQKEISQTQAEILIIQNMISKLINEAIMANMALQNAMNVSTGVSTDKGEFWNELFKDTTEFVSTRSTDIDNYFKRMQEIFERIKSDNRS
jgi:hypothetical protein